MIRIEVLHDDVSQAGLGQSLREEELDRLEPSRESAYSDDGEIEPPHSPRWPAILFIDRGKSVRALRHRLHSPLGSVRPIL
jgi:hypothetical protein